MILDWSFLSSLMALSSWMVILDLGGGPTGEEFVPKFGCEG